MPKRYWIIVFAFGLVVSAPVVGQDDVDSTLKGEPISTRQQEESADAGDDNGGNELPDSVDPTPALVSIEAAIRDLITEEGEVNRERQNEREIRDLNAQEGMALWAKLMFWATAITVLLTCIALFAIIRTLHHTRRAADYASGMLDEAKATTGAAKDTIQATEKIGALQLKAYVGVKSVSITLAEDGEYVETDVKIVVGNTGATPATIPFLATTTEFRHVPEMKPSLGSTGHAQTGERIVGPNSEFIISTGQRSKRIGDAPIGRYKIGVLVRYRDIYGAESVESSWWHHRPLQTDNIGGRTEISLYPLKQAAGEQEGLTEAKWK